MPNPIINWFFKGQNLRIPNESSASWWDLIKDDWKQRGKFGKGGSKGGWDITRGFRPGVSAEEGGFGSGPTPLGRQAVLRLSPLGLASSIGGSTPQDNRWLNLGYESEDAYNNAIAERAAIEGEYVEPEPLLNQVFSKF